jgi:tetratricopeptide (TPR) repeat protein
MISALVDQLAMFYQSGNLTQVEVISRSMLTAIPEDIVALQFLGLALYQMGRMDDARRAFKRVAARQDRPQEAHGLTVCEPAHCATFREATRAHSGLADGWYRIALALKQFGFHRPARRALAAALASSGKAPRAKAMLARLSDSQGERDSLASQLAFSAREMPLTR